ncbi:MAG: hypothetical protein HY529_04235 [Chloroflexi bacterium]|nr:hypothetical protein [Chloroflexota bacterium]
MKSFIVEFWAKIFDILGWISLFRIIRWLFDKINNLHKFFYSYGFVELWVLTHLSLSAIFLSTWPAIGTVVYGAFRVFELIVYQVNVLLFDEYRAKKTEYIKRKTGEIYTSPYALRGYRRILILATLNYVEIIFWFALFYYKLSWAFDTHEASLNSFFNTLHFSLITMTGFGSTPIYPIKTLGYALTSINMAIGLFMALLILARFISFLPKPKTMDEFER